MPMTKIELTNFTVFESLVVDLAPGINVFVGDNGTGKTTLLRVTYSAINTRSEDRSPSWISGQLLTVFMPHGADVKRLIRHSAAQAVARITYDANRFVELEIERRGVQAASPFSEYPIGHTAYIPSDLILENAPGFLSLYGHREVHFSSIHKDLLLSAYLPALRELDPTSLALANLVETTIGGCVEIRGEKFFFIPNDGSPEIEFDLLASGFQKLGLLWLLIKNGEVGSGHVLFWDEPETNLNPKLMKVVAEVLVGLARNGLQVLLATHDYAFLKELELASQPSDGIRYNALYKDHTGKVLIKWSDAPFRVEHNPVAEAVGDLYERELAHLISKQGGAQ